MHETMWFSLMYFFSLFIVQVRDYYNSIIDTILQFTVIIHAY